MMRARTLLLLGFGALLATPSPASPDVALLPLTQEVQQQVASSSSSPTEFVTPEDRVAAMFREALRAPDQDENWACLDLALSEMDAPAGGSEGFDSRTQRIADSLARPTGSSASSSLSLQTPTGGSQAESTFDRLLGGAWQGLNLLMEKWNGLMETEPLVFPSLLLALGLFLFWIGRRSVRIPSRKGRSGGSSGRRHPFRAGASKSGESPQTLALALWQGGLPSTEIARRTGLAQDALAVLFAIIGKDQAMAASGPRNPAPPNPYAQMGMERN